jgi:hypothetical protein
MFFAPFVPFGGRIESMPVLHSAKRDAGFICGSFFQLSRSLLLGFHWQQ